MSGTQVNSMAGGDSVNEVQNMTMGVNALTCVVPGVNQMMNTGVNLMAGINQGVNTGANPMAFQGRVYITNI